MFLRSRLTLLKPQFIAFQAAPTSRRSSAARFCSGSAEPSEKMEKTEEHQKPPATTGNIMWDSFGHEYATRSDEEGFGGIYGSNQSLRKDVDDQHNPVISAEQNDSQGRETKQEEADKHGAD